MPSWNEILNELDVDQIRRKYLKKLYQHTDRNVIAYYSGWLQKPQYEKSSINDGDKNGFMNAVYGLDRTKGLDLILHTPGGEITATESIVHYLKTMFNKDIRVIVPQIAMSAGTMIACAAKKIIMGKHSNLGPIDPHIGGIPAYGVIEEFEKAIKDVKNNPYSLPMWQLIIKQYHPTFLGTCQKAIDLAKEIVTDWLVDGMLEEISNARAKAKSIVEALSDCDNNKSHSRHIHLEEARNYGLMIEELESDNTLQDLVLTVHHAFMHSLSNTAAIKIIENHEGNAIVENIFKM